MLTTWNDVSFQDGLSYKNTILTYNLADTELQVLCDSIRRLTNRQLKVFNAEHYLDLYTVPHFLAFINFANIQEEAKQDYFVWRRECEGQFIVIDGERFDLHDSLTYIFGCNNPVKGLPKMMFNSDVFGNKDMLKQILLQEIKNQENDDRETKIQAK